MGLEIEDVVSGARWTTRVETIERLGPADHYDIALIMVRRDQLESVMPELSANQGIPNLLFMLNNPDGVGQLVEVLGKERVLLGFPGAGGTRDGNVVRYALIKQQPTTVGELGGLSSDRLRKVVDLFRTSVFPTKISHNIDAWLKAHAFFFTSVSGAIYLAGGDCKRLSEDKPTLALMTRGVRQGFAAVRALGLPVTSFPLKVLFTWLPPSFGIYYWRKFFASRIADYVFGRHARSASQEMGEVSKDCMRLLEKTGVEAPALQQLYLAIDEYAAGRSAQTQAQ